jgi:DNA-binding MarR family transcriptional regulator
MPLEPFVTALQEWIGMSTRNSMHHFLRYARESGLSMSHFGAMFHILRSGHCGVTDLGEHLGVSSAASSQMLDRLVQLGFIVRTEDPKDRRGKQIGLTDKGRRVLKGGIHAQQEWVKKLAATLTPGEKEVILEGLNLLNKRVNYLDPHPKLELNIEKGES